MGSEMCIRDSPLTVSDAYPLCGAFSRASDATAESKLNPAFIVPATPPTVTHVLTSTANSASLGGINAVWHLTFVRELQLDVRHVCSDSTDVCVASLVPKFSPITVTDAYPLAGVLSSPYESTAASKLTLSTFVPPTAPTVTAIDCPNRWVDPVPIPTPSPPRHDTLVAELQDDVSHLSLIHI